MNATAKSVRRVRGRTEDESAEPVRLSPNDVIDAIRAGAGFEDDVPLTRVQWATQRDNQFASLDDDPSANVDATRTVEVSSDVSDDRTYASFQINGSAFSPPRPHTAAERTTLAR